MIRTIVGSNTKPVASRQLADLLSSQTDEEGTLYIGYPIISTPAGSFAIDALLLSPTYGLVAFDLVEAKNLSDFADRQDEVYTKLQARLLPHRDLVKKKELQVTITVLTYAPAIRDTDKHSDDEHLIVNDRTMLAALADIAPQDSSIFPALASVIQTISAIRKGRKRREVSSATSRGGIVRSLEDSIANLDGKQGSAVIETFDGVQRIRGLAGSGKTIVLALKVAYLHARHPEWQIVVTFNTRSLKAQFRKLISDFVLEQTGDDPDWDKVRVIHAWGAPGPDKEGLYYEFCRENKIRFRDFRSAQREFGEGREFDGACEAALKEATGYRKTYDAILVDEAQDFSPHFLNLCFESLREPHRLTYAYDELQSLNKKSLPSPEAIFGKDNYGNPRVRFEPPQRGRPSQDIVLSVCYRNSRPVLTTAHALGFGIYRDPDGLIQMFENKELWREIGYEVESGNLIEGSRVRLARTAESSPLFLESHSSIDDLVQFHCFDSDEDQIQWLVTEISRNIQREELQPEDIVVINPDPLTTRSAVATARKLLNDSGINTTLAGISSSPDVFFETKAVTFTGVFRAKGNEAPMVYVINAHDCYEAWRGELARVRNRLFTAMTRSKAWVRVCGVGPMMARLKSEFERLKASRFALEFKYPTSAEREELNIINRDMTAEEKRAIEGRKSSLAGIIESLESGETLLEDYPPEILRKLEDILKRGPR